MRRQSLLRRWSVVALGVALLGLALPMTGATASEARVVVAGAAPIPSNVSVVNKSITTTFDVTLAPRSAKGLANYIASLSNTASANFDHFLTPTGFASRFGASASSLNTVRNYFDSFGLNAGSLSKGRLVLHVKGTTSEIARAFASSVETVRRTNGVLAAQLAKAGTVPAPVAHDIAGVAGLSSVVQPSTNIVAPRVSSDGVVATTCPDDGGETSTVPNALSGYTPFQFAQLYGLSSEWADNVTGTGQTIAVYELSAYDPGDLATYLSCYGLDPSITPISVDNGPTGGYDNEPTLDVEEIAAMAPGAAIEIYQGPNNSTGPIDTYQQIADDDTATIVSTSWGTCESDPDGDPSAEQPIFEEMAAQGQTVMSAAGDAGSSDCNGITNNNPAVDDPASQPYVTGVGGLTVNNIDPLSQSVWNTPSSKDYPAGAGGGGASILWSHPSWQSAPGVPANASMRLVPDLSVDADPATGFVEYYTGTGQGVCHQNCDAGWSNIGGTSIGSPLVSSLVAVAAQACGTARLGFINPSLYAMASTGFIDVTSGTNDLYDVGEYSAGVGYDEASGLGSPDGAAFFAGLCPPKFDVTKSSFAVSKSSAVVTVPITITANLRDTNANPIVNAVADVTATSVSGDGRIAIDGAYSTSAEGAGVSADVTTDATGAAQFTVTDTNPGAVTVEVTYQAATIYSTTVHFTASAKATSKVPGQASIAKLTSLVGGFTLVVKAPASNGGSAITSYQYSVTNGVKWAALVKGSKSIKVSNLVKGKSYRVSVRALNAHGAGAASAPKTIVTRK